MATGQTESVADAHEPGKFSGLTAIDPLEPFNKPELAAFSG